MSHKLVLVNVRIAIEVDHFDSGTVADTVSSILTESLMFRGVINDWEYLKDKDGEYSSPQVIGEFYDYPEEGEAFERFDQENLVS